MITLQERVHAALKPDDWQLDKLHQVFRVRRGNKNTDMKEDNLLSLSYGRIIQKDIETADGLLPENFEGYQIVEPGNIVLRLTDLQNDKRSLRQGLVTQRGIITSAYDAVEIQRDNDPRFWFYSLLALDLAKHYYSLGGGVRQSVKFADFPNDWVYRPDLATQRQIADFLDRETARIDLLIEKKQRLVALQNERRQSTLERLVLGGARASRTTGKDWIVDLPAEWQAQPLKHLVAVFGGATPSKDREDYWQGDIPWVSPKDMKNDVLDSASDYISREALMNSPLVLVPAQSILIVVRGMILARHIPVCRLNMPATINQDMKALIAKKSKINPEYLQVMLQGFQNILMSFVEEAAHGTKKLRSEELFSLKFPVPPLSQQLEIVERLGRVSHQVGRSNALIEQSIDRLKEYRSALITAAVTGQIDVQTYAKSGTPDRRLDAIQEEMQA